MGTGQRLPDQVVLNKYNGYNIFWLKETQKYLVLLHPYRFPSQIQRKPPETRTGAPARLSNRAPAEFLLSRSPSIPFPRFLVTPFSHSIRSCIQPNSFIREIARLGGGAPEQSRKRYILYWMDCNNNIINKYYYYMCYWFI